MNSVIHVEGHGSFSLTKPRKNSKNLKYGIESETNWPEPEVSKKRCLLVNILPINTPSEMDIKVVIPTPKQ